QQDEASQHRTIPDADISECGGYRHHHGRVSPLRCTGGGVPVYADTRQPGSAAAITLTPHGVATTSAFACCALGLMIFFARKLSLVSACCSSSRVRRSRLAMPSRPSISA